MKLSDFPTEKPVFTTEYVIKQNADIVYVSLDQDNDLHMFSEEGAEMDKAMLVSIQNIIEKDNSLLEIPNLEKEDQFYRNNKKSKWTKLA